MDKKTVVIIGGTLVGMGLAFGVGFLGGDSSSPENNSSSESNGLLPSLFSSDSSQTSGKEMRLETYTGQVTLFQGTETKPIVEGARLISQDQLETFLSSYAYLSLDSSKALRMNETSLIEIQQEGQLLDIYVKNGSLFFHVSESLGEEESLNFHTNNVVTGVRGTSGIITWDALERTSQIVVLSGVVQTTTSNEEKEVHSGEIALAKTHSDGTVTLEIQSLEEYANYLTLPTSDNDTPPTSPLSYHYNDTFVDQIQTDFFGEDTAFLLSEAVRDSHLPPVVTLPDSIEVLGNSRTMSPEQAKAFAQEIRNMPTLPKFILFFDGGDGIPVMVMGEEYNYFFAGVQYTQSLNSHLRQWNGTSVETPYFGSQILHNVYERNGTFWLSVGTDARHYQGADTTTYYLYPFQQGQRSSYPEALYASNWYYYTNYFNSDFDWSLVGPLTDSNLWISYKSRYENGAFGNSYFVNGSWLFGDITEYLGNGLASLSGQEIMLLNNAPSFSPYWNNTEDVLKILES